MRAALLLVLTFLFVPLTADAGRKKLRVTKEHYLDIKQRTKTPTFTSFNSPLLVDDGKLLAYGKGIHQDQGMIYLLDLATLKEKTYTFDVDAWFAAHRAQFPSKGKGPLARGSIEGLLYLDSKAGTAGLVALNAGRNTMYLLVGDLAKGTITTQVVLGTAGAKEWIAHMPLLHQDGTLYAFVQQGNLNTGKVTGRVVSVKDGNATELAKITADHEFITNAAVDPVRKRVLLPRYAEKGGRVTGTTGALVNLDKGTVTDIPIPTTTYGAAFSDDGSVLYTFSSDTGMLWKIGVDKGKKLAEVKVGDLGFPVGWIAPDRLVVLRNATVEEVDPTTMKKKGSGQLKTLKVGFWHTQGSIFLGTGGRAAVRNGEDLYIVTIE